MFVFYFNLLKYKKLKVGYLLPFISVLKKRKANCKQMRMCSTYFLILETFHTRCQKGLKHGDNSLHSNGGIRNKQKVGNLVHLKTADKQILTANLPFLMRKQTAVGISIPHLSLSKFPSMCIEYFYVFIKKVYCVIGRNKSGTSVKHSGVISSLFFLVKVDALSNN